MTRTSMDPALAGKHVIDKGVDGLSLFSQQERPSREISQVEKSPIVAAPPHPFARWASLSDTERKAQRERWEAQLLPIVIRIADVAAGDGITASDVMSHGITEGVLNGERAFLTANPKVYSFLGTYLVRLAYDGILAPKLLRVEGAGEDGRPATVHVSRVSQRAASHRNKQLVYVAAKYATVRAA